MANVNLIGGSCADLGSNIVVTTVCCTVGICKIFRTGSTDLRYTFQRRSAISTVGYESRISESTLEEMQERGCAQDLCWNFGLLLTQEAAVVNSRD